MIKVALTGGIGSGKTFICDVLKHIGVPVYYADIEAKKIIENNTEIINKLIKLFGKKIYSSSGLNNILLSEIIFNNKDSLLKVNKIVHPEVLKNYEEWLNKYKDNAYTLHEAAILYENDLDSYFDKVILVCAPVEVRIARVMTRHGMTHDKIIKIMENQLSDSEKITKADFIINNDEKNLILPQIIEIHKSILL